MPRCYWNNLCNCPDKTPVGTTCDEHQGINCSILNGRTITDVAQVRDANTIMLEAAIAAMDADERRLVALQAEAETIRREATDVEGELRRGRDRIDSGQTSLSERTRIANRARAISDQIKDWNATLQQWPNELRAIAENRDNVIQRGLRLLDRPYATPLGYCECHDEKVRRLRRIDNLITTDLADLNNKRIQAQLAFDRLAGLLALLVLIAVLSFDSSLFLGALFSAVLSGGATAIVLFGVLLAVLALVLLAALYTIQLLSALRALVDIKRRLLKEILWYYRTQLIPTCMQLEKPLSSRARRAIRSWEKQLTDDLSPRARRTRPAPGRSTRRKRH